MQAVDEVERTGSGVREPRAAGGGVVSQDSGKGRTRGSVVDGGWRVEQEAPKCYHGRAGIREEGKWLANQSNYRGVRPVGSRRFCNTNENWFCSLNM